MVVQTSAASIRARLGRKVRQVRRGHRGPLARKALKAHRVSRGQMAPKGLRVRLGQLDRKGLKDRKDCRETPGHRVPRVHRDQLEWAW